MANTYTLIASNTLGSSAASVTFSSIPADYTDLVVRVSGRSDSAGFTTFTGKFNSSTSNYSYTRIRGNGASATSNRSSSPGYVYGGILSDSTSTANTFSSFEWYIPSYTATQNKILFTLAANENNLTTAYTDVLAVLWSNTAAITQIDFLPSSGNFVSGSSFFLYGISNS